MKKIFGEDHVNVATSYNNLALVYNRLGEYNQGKEFHQKALTIRKKSFGEDHADVHKLWHLGISAQQPGGKHLSQRTFRQRTDVFQKDLSW